MRTFEVCARRLSFSAAAAELRLTQGAVSKQIKTLEQNLGLQLFQRRGNSIALTPEGKDLARHLTSMFDDLDDFIGSLGPDTVKSSLVVSCEPTICMKLLIPLAPNIEAETGVSLRILSGGGPVDFQHYGIDLAIRRNDFDFQPDIDTFTLGPELMGPVARSDIAFAMGERAESYTRIHASTRPGAWRRWAKTGDEHTESDNRFQADIEHQHHFLALEAAESGHGIAMMSVYMVARTLELSRLWAPRGFIADGSEYICLSRSPIANDPRKTAVAEWLRRKFSEYADAFGKDSAAR